MKGYTLIELLLVITIMAILFTIVTFTIPIAKFKVESKIDSIAADLRWARKMAIIDQQTYIFRIYTNSQNSNGQIPYYFYTKKNKELTIKRKGYYPSDFILYKTLSFKIVEGEYYEWIRFNHTATARGGTIAFAKAGENPENNFITVNQLGRVRVEK